MEQNLTQLCDLDPMLDDVNIVARCISIWKVHPTGNPKDVWSLDCGNRVPDSCKKDHINKFHGLLDEGSCYRIGKQSISPALYSTNMYLNDDIPEIAAFRYNEQEPAAGRMELQEAWLNKSCWNELYGVQVHTLIKQYGEEVDDYFPTELNVMTGKKLLFLFEYTTYHISKNNHVYSVKEVADDESMITTFKKDFINEETLNDLDTPEFTRAELNKFKTGDKIPFNMEDTPKSTKVTTMTDGESGINAYGGDVSGSSDSVKRNYIDLNDYPHVDEVAKRSKKIVAMEIDPINNEDLFKTAENGVATLRR
ncbi:replication protein A 70 kDa DNA-binding subunit B [Tanacetum coccineum]